MRHIHLTVALLLVALVGCSSATTKMADPVPITGTLTSADGQPVGNVLLMLQPTVTGFMVGCEVDKDGKFTGEAVPGSYAWFINRSAKATDADAALAKVKEDLQRGSLDRQVKVGSGSVDIKLP